MTEIPQTAIDAAAKALHQDVCDLPDCPSAGTDRQRDQARIVLEAAEQVWPHSTPVRDPASTINSATERAWAPTVRRGAASRVFGFGPPKATT